MQQIQYRQSGNRIEKGGGVATWLPTNIPNCVGDWFSDYGITQSGGLISNVLDRSGKLHPAYQATDANKPLYSVVGGINVFEVDGANHYLIVDHHADFNFQGAYTIIGWIYLTRTSENYDILVSKAGSYALYTVAPGGTSNIHLYNLSIVGDKDIQTVYGTVDCNLWRMYSVTVTTGLGTLFYEFDTLMSLLAGGDHGGNPTITTNPLQLFAGTGWGLYLKGYVGAITLYTSPLTQTEITEYYTNTKLRYGY